MKHVNIIRDGKVWEVMTPGEFSAYVRIAIGDYSGLSAGLDAYVEQFNDYNVRVGLPNRAEVQS